MFLAAMSLAAMFLAVASLVETPSEAAPPGVGREPTCRLGRGEPRPSAAEAHCTRAGSVTVTVAPSVAWNSASASCISG